MKKISDENVDLIISNELLCDLDERGLEKGASGSSIKS